MARPKGSKNKPGARKPGKPANSSKVVVKMAPEEIMEVKRAILQLIEAEEADNLTEACEKLGFPKLKAHNWFKMDKEWANEVRVAQEIKADRLEADLDEMNNPVARIFRLKKLRMEYRDTYKFDIHSDALEKYLEELTKLAKKDGESSAA